MIGFPESLVAEMREIIANTLGEKNTFVTHGDIIYTRFITLLSAQIHDYSYTIIKPNQ